MGRRKKTSSRSFSEPEPLHITDNESEVNDTFSVLTAEQANYILANPRIFTEIFQDNTPGFTILHQICKEGDARLLCDMVRLMESSPLPALRETALERLDLESKYTPLHDAISHGNINCAVKLIRYGASLATPALDGFTPLDLAVWNQFKNGFVPESKSFNILTWGANSNYNLGHGHDKSLKLPEKVKRFNRDKFRSSICNVNFGKYHTLFLDKAGYVYACGHGQGGRLGLGSEQTFLEPQLIPDLQNIVKISCSNDHSLALTADGRVYSWGVNTHKVLGHTEHKNFFRPQIIRASFTFSKIITVKAAKYHSVLVASDQIYTFGFNGGQIGHNLTTELYQIVPRAVTRLLHKPGQNLGKIAHVHASAAATVVGFENGSIFICNKYDIRKVASLNRYNTSVSSLANQTYSLTVKTKKIRVTGGSLARQVNENTNKPTKPLLISILDTNGLVFACVPDMFKNVLIYHWDVYMEKFLVTDISLGSYSLMLLTTNGEVFSCNPYPTLKSEKEIKRDHSQKTWSALHSRKKEAVQMLRPIKLLKQAGLHNGTKIVCNGTGLVKACIVQDRISTLDFRPTLEQSTFVGDISALYDNDEVYDTDITVYCASGKQIAAHKAILANASTKLEQIVVIADEAEHSYIEIPGSDEIVTAMLGKIYMLHDQPVFKRESQNPAKYPLLYNGFVNPGRCVRINRDVITKLTDVVLVSEDGVKYNCHRCILAARVEYFLTHFMINFRWGSANLNDEIPVDANQRTLGDFIYYIYTDLFPVNYSLESLTVLLKLSDQYLVSRLKSFCEVHLVEFITEENLLHLLCTANYYNAESLRVVCLHIVAMNMPYYLEYRLLECLEEELLDKLDAVYREVVLFHIQRPLNKDYSIMEYFRNLTNWGQSKSEAVGETKVKEDVYIRGLPLQLEEYISDEESQMTDSSKTAVLVDSEITNDCPPERSQPVENSTELSSETLQEVNINKKFNDRAACIQEPSGKKHVSEKHVEQSIRKDNKTSTSSTKPLRQSWGNSTQPATNKSLSEIMQEEERQRGNKQIVTKPPPRKNSKGKETISPPCKAPEPQSPTSSPRGAGSVTTCGSPRSPTAIPWGACSATTCVSPRSPTSNPWGACSPTTCVSLKDIMSSENPGSTKKQKQRTPPSAPPKAPSGISETFDFMPDRQVYSLRLIMEAEAASQHPDPRAVSRPLNAIQIEERAIQELRVLYKAEESVNEFITIKTVAKFTVGQPTWGKNGQIRSF